ncbi:uncharacterized protein LOC135943538 [Cloeon dipterum]|uniref:uncharacterized protein LOC135943538 n=1 Tax=Cloeon dipterum TaxID=197152 RepID=UPI00321FAE28
MAKYESRKRRSIPEPNVLFIALYIMIYVPSTRGISIEFEDQSVDHWKIAFGANSKQITYDFCKYNGTSTGMQCKNFHPEASIDFEKVCNCNIQHDKTNDGSLSFDLGCNSNLSYCPKELTVTYRQGSYARAPDPDVATSGLNGWLVDAFVISTLFNVLFVIAIIACLMNENFYDFLKEKWNRTINREHETDIDSPERGLPNTSLKLKWRKPLEPNLFASASSSKTT